MEAKGARKRWTYAEGATEPLVLGPTETLRWEPAPSSALEVAVDELLDEP